MGAESEDSVRFSKWVARPQSIIALSALLLSVCGVFIAIYEAALVRRQQRASAWPRVEVAASMTGEKFEVWVQNVGVGPARVRAAALTQDGEPRGSWAELIRGAGADPKGMGWYYSRIGGRVLPRDSEPETIFRFTEASGAGAAELLASLQRDVLEGRIDLILCYCSVFDECWESALQEVMGRSRDAAAVAGERVVSSCDGAARSGI